MAKTPWVPELDTLYSDCWITEVLGTVQSGKEATVYCCRADVRVGADLVAAKVYHPREQRNFKNDAVYREGRWIRDARTRRAVAGKTRSGRNAAADLWVTAEFETLQNLHAAGADVPKPYVRFGSVVLIEYLGNVSTPAPQLCSIALDRAEAGRLFKRLTWNLELWLECGCVHGDLSAFNILYWNGQIKVIDFPQAVDPFLNRNAFMLLLRDVENTCSYFARQGVSADPYSLTRSLWDRFRRRGS